MLKNYKIKVKNEADSKEAQELFFELGCEWNGGVGKSQIKPKYNEYYLFVKNGLITYCDSSEVELNCVGCSLPELTLPQLRDLVVLHRNDVKDANYQYCDRPVLKLETQGYKVWDSENNAWNEYIGSQTDFRKGINPIQPEPEQGLISGADALRALADGKEVEYKTRANNWNLINKNDAYALSLFLDDDSSFSFRLKPHTIKLSLEIPAPFEPKVGEEYYYLNSGRESGYAMKLHDGKHMDFMAIQFGAWRTEEEIKQVVAALRGGIKG